MVLIHKLYFNLISSVALIFIKGYYLYHSPKGKKMDISKSIQHCLDDTGIKKLKLAEKLGVSQQTVSTLMKSEKCTGDMLNKLAEAFNMPVSEFVALGE